MEDVKQTTDILVRKLALCLMTRDNDISEESYQYLLQLLDNAGHTDIIDAVDATDGRFYLPDGFDFN